MRLAGTRMLLVAIFASTAQAALAQPAKYPDRPIRLIVPFPPGGSVDVHGRILAPAVSKSLGQQVVRPGVPLARSSQP